LYGGWQARPVRAGSSRRQWPARSSRYPGGM